jgi:hypothetical protein
MPISSPFFIAVFPYQLEVSSKCIVKKKIRRDYCTKTIVFFGIVCRETSKFDRARSQMFDQCTQNSTILKTIQTEKAEDKQNPLAYTNSRGSKDTLATLLKSFTGILVSAKHVLTQ